MRNFIIGITLSLTLPHIAIAQLTELQRGKELPSVTFTNVRNYSKNTLKLSDFEGKLLILDFWSFNCLSCFQSFPRIDEIQKQFPDNVQFVLVNKEGEKETEEFFAKRTRIFQPKLPMITGDTLLNQLFPHQGVPYHIWVDKDGKVLYKTNGYNSKEKNIERYLAGEDIGLFKKTRSKPIYTHFDQQYENQIVEFRYLAKQIDGIESGNLPAEPKGINFILSPQTPIQLYQRAFSGLGNFNIDFSYPNRTILVTPDGKSHIYTERLALEGYDSLLTNRFGYMANWRQGTHSKGYQMLLEDLNHTFDLEAKIVTKNVKSYVLIQTGDLGKLKTKGGTPRTNFVRQGLRYNIADSIISITNMPFTWLAEVLGKDITDNMGRLFKNTVHYKGNIDFTMHADPLEDSDMNGIRRALNAYNLDLVERIVAQKILEIKLGKNEK